MENMKYEMLKKIKHELIENPEKYKSDLTKEQKQILIDFRKGLLINFNTH